MDSPKSLAGASLPAKTKKQAAHHGRDASPAKIIAQLFQSETVIAIAWTWPVGENLPPRGIGIKELNPDGEFFTLPFSFKANEWLTVSHSFALKLNI